MLRHRLCASAVISLWFVGPAGTLSLAGAEKLELPPGLSLWHESVNLRTGFGYKDNVTLSSSAPAGSAFEAAGLEVMVFRLPWNNWQFSFFANGADTRYFDRSAGVDAEQDVASSAQLTWLAGRGWQSLSTLQYAYLNQVLDVSTTAQAAERVQIRGHSLTGQQGVRKDFGKIWAELSFGVTRNFFQLPLDNYWQGGPRLTLGRRFGQNSELSLSYQAQRLQFDTREQTQLDGTLIPGAPLEFALHTVDLSWLCHWGDQRRWTSTTRLNAQVNRDNGPGFYDYQQYRATEQLRYRVQRWEVSAQASVAQLDFDQRNVSATDLATRHRSSILFRARGEMRLTKSWKVYASYDHEQSLANRSADRYEANVGLAGIEYEF